MEAKIERSVSRVLNSCFWNDGSGIVFLVDEHDYCCIVIDGIYALCIQRPAGLRKGLAGEHKL